MTAAQEATDAPAGRPLRLLMTADAVGGVWSYVLDLAGALRRRDVDVVLALLGPSASPRQWAQAREIGVDLVDTGLPLDWTAADAAQVSAAGDAVAALAHSLNVDAVQLNSPALAAETDFEVPVIGVCHSCLATWWRSVRGDAPMPEDFRWRIALLRAGYERCDRLVAPGHAFARDTADTHGIAPPYVVHNGRDAPDVPSEHAGTREAMIFTSGRLWDEGKNIAALDRAAALIEAPVYAAGPLAGPDGGVPVALANASALGQLSHDEVRQWLARAPVFVSTARYEPFGLGVLEAAQAGCALVLSDIAGFRELWDGVAMFVPVDDEQAIASIVQTLIDDPLLAMSSGQEARRRAAAYTVDTMADGMIAHYRAAMARSGKSLEAAA